MKAGAQLTFSFSLYDLPPGDATAYLQVESPLSSQTHLELCFYADSKPSQAMDEDERS